MKKGKVSIEFAILKDGTVSGMKLVPTSGDAALDRGAWGGIVASSPFPPLPSEFLGQYLALRFAFYYNPAKGDVEGDVARKKATHSCPVLRLQFVWAEKPESQCLQFRLKWSAGQNSNSLPS